MFEYVLMARSLVIWFPDWPVSAATHAAGAPVDVPVAVLDKGVVFACSAPARAFGVRRGQRVRDAQAKCPGLLVFKHDQAVDLRAFEPVLAGVEVLIPGVESIRPGSCAVDAHGPSRYFGGEQQLVAALSEHLGTVLAGEPIADHLLRFHLGVADGVFAAAQAAAQARRTGAPWVLVEPGGSAAFLAPLSIDALDRPELTDLLRRLGIRTLGGFAGLPGRAVASRFGVEGVLAHRLAGGQDQRLLAIRQPPTELATELHLDPPVGRIDELAFTAGPLAERLITGLADRDLVCTRLRVEIRSEHGEELLRSWRHPRWFSVPDVLDRIRWQLQSSGAGPGLSPATGRAGGITGAVTGVRLVPEEAEPVARHAEGLWGDRVPEERVHRALTRVQSMLGHTAVVTADAVGGRGYPERLEWVAWGDTSHRAPGAARRAGPAGPVARHRSEPSIGAKIRAERPTWPGHLPAPAPAAIAVCPRQVRLLDPAGWPIRVSNRQVLSGVPDRLEIGRDEDAETVAGWAGPWQADERCWDPATARRRFRLQVIGGSGHAYLLAYEQDQWSVEANYD